MTRPRRLALAVGLALSLAVPAVAAGPGGWDHLGDAGTPGSDSLNGTASALHAGAPGSLYVGGNFTDAGGIAEADRIAAWNGTNWAAVGPGIDNGAVRAIAYADGKVYAGGTFLNAGGNADADFLAVWNGTTWAPFCNAVGPAFAGNVDALQVVGSTLYVGGEFQNAGNVATADYLAACELGTGALTATTADPAHFFSGPVYALTADAGGRLYAGGRFGDLENLPAADNVAFLDGSGWHAMGAGGGVCGCAIDTFVRSLAADASGVYVGTDQKDVAGIAEADSVVRWDGTAWSALGDGTWFPASTFVYGLAAFDGNVVATGSFQNAGGFPTADNIVAYVGGTWHDVGSDGAGNGPFTGNGLALAPFAGRLYVAGGFTSAGGDPQAHGIASRPLPVVATAVPTPTVTPSPSPVPTPTVTPSPLGVTITSGPADGSVIRDNTPTFAFTSTGATGAICYDNAKATGVYHNVACTSPYTLSARADGKHDFTVGVHGFMGEVVAPLRTYTVDTSKPVATVLGPIDQPAGKTIGVQVGCGAEACTAAASGTVDVPGAARVYRLAKARKAVAAGRKVTLRVGVPKQARKAIRGALHRHRKVTARLTVRVRDAAGNTRSRQRRVRLKR